MATTSSINYKQALQVAGIAIAVEGMMRPADLFSKVATVVLGVLVGKGIDIVYREGKKYYVTDQLNNDFLELDRTLAYYNCNVDVYQRLCCHPDVEPYLGLDSKALIKTIKQSVPPKNEMSFTANNPDVVCYLLPHVASRILENLPEQEVGRFSLVNKCCYLATKAYETPSFWEKQLKELLPEFLPVAENDFPLELQFKILYRDFGKPEQDVRREFNTYYNRVNFLTGPTRFDGEIDRVWHQEGHSDKYRTLDAELKRLTGAHYDGSVHSIAPESQLGFLKQQLEWLMLENRYRSLNDDIHLFEAMKKFLDTGSELSLTTQQLDKLLKEMQEKIKLLKKLDEGDDQNFNKKLDEEDAYLRRIRTSLQASEKLPS